MCRFSDENRCLIDIGNWSNFIGALLLDVYKPSAADDFSLDRESRDSVSALRQFLHQNKHDLHQEH